MKFKITKLFVTAGTPPPLKNNLNDFELLWLNGMLIKLINNFQIKAFYGRGEFSSLSPPAPIYTQNRLSMLPFS